jgi:hypothetical protein
MKNKAFLVCGLWCVVLVGCGAEPTARPGVIVAYGDTQVTISDLDQDPLPAGSARDATRQDLLELQTEVLCAYPEGASALQVRAHVSAALQEREVDQDSFDALNDEIGATTEFMDALAVEMNLRCPAQLAKLLAQ